MSTDKNLTIDNRETFSDVGVLYCHALARRRNG